MAKKEFPEQEIQINFMAYIAQSGVDGLFVFHVPNGQNVGPFVGTKLQRMGLVAGMPDLMLIHKGHIFGLEIKNDKPRGKLSTAQHLTMAALREAGVECAVAYGIQDCIDQLDAWRLTKRWAKTIPFPAGAKA